MSAQAETTPKRGVKTKILGVGLLFVGLMDSMLAWRGGFEVAEFYVVFIAAGLALIAIGTLRQRRDSRRLDGVIAADGIDKS